MGRIREGHRCYRTKDEIVRDIVFVLNAPLAYGTQEAVLRNACWVWTESDGKYDGCAYWSKAAKTQELLYVKQQLDGLEPPKVERIHEHIVPKQIVCQLLRELSPATPEAVRDICGGS